MRRRQNGEDMIGVQLPRHAAGRDTFHLQNRIAYTYFRAGSSGSFRHSASTPVPRGNLAIRLFRFERKPRPFRSRCHPCHPELMRRKSQTRSADTYRHTTCRVICSEKDTGYH